MISCLLYGVFRIQFPHALREVYIYIYIYIYILRVELTVYNLAHFKKEFQLIFRPQSPVFPPTLFPSPSPPPLSLFLFLSLSFQLYFPSLGIISITLSSLWSSPVWHCASGDVSTSISIYVTAATLTHSVCAAGRCKCIWMLCESCRCVL